MSSISDRLEPITTARQSLADAEETLYRARLEVQREQNPGSLAAVQERLQAVSDQYATAREEVRQSIAALYQDRSAKDLLSELDGNFPILLLPVRIETRFITANESNELWLRIYPDDIHIHTHETLLTQEELEAGQAYWTSLSEANATDSLDPEEEKRAAWTALSGSFGVARALWVAKQCQPEGWTPEVAVPGDQLVFPAHDLTKTHAWTQAPRSTLLPDRFVVRIYRGEEVVHEQIGQAVPDEVFTGPDPFRAEEAFRATDEAIEFDDDFAWTVNFEQAVEKGLGMKISLTPAMFNHDRIDRITVLGVMASAAPEESSDLLGQLIESHTYTGDGFGLLPQGTPTNNTETDRSGFSDEEDLLAKGYYDGAVPSLFTDHPEADGLRLAEALGIDPHLVESAPHADLREHHQAKAMNTVLYPATAGYFFEVLMEPVIETNAHEHLRSFFSNYVSARGSLPAFRTDNQPYSLLVTSDLSSWEKTDADALFFQRFAAILEKLQRKWDQLTTQHVAHVGQAGDPSAILLDLLGLHPGSVSFAQRLGNLPDLYFSLPNVDNQSFQSEADARQASIIDFLRDLGYQPEEEDNIFSFGSNLTYYQRTSQISFKNLIDGRKATNDRFLEPIEGLDLTYIEWLAQVSKVEDLEKHNFGGAKPPQTVLYLLLRHAFLQELERKAEQFFLTNDITFRRGATVKSLFNFNAETKDLTSWEVLNGIPNQLSSTQLDIAKPLGDHLLDQPPAAEDIIGINDMRNALKTLSPLSTASLQRLLAQHVDLCTYRLDAWQTGLFERRLEQQRAEHAKGLYVGAYGWIENLCPRAPQELDQTSVPEQLRPPAGETVTKFENNAGLVHTPSLNQAVAAGLLLAGYHNHATEQDPSPFAVNLSSSRVRRAQFAFQAVRQGQMLEAVLGYQFERALHDITTAGEANLNKYILIIREKYPVRTQFIPQQGLDEENVQESIPAYSVVNGLKLVEVDISEVLGLVEPDDRPLIQEVIDGLKDTLDAMNDLLTAESANQVAQGNYDRTVGLLNAARGAEVPPPLEVAKTPRSNNLTYPNRVCIHFNAKALFKAGNRWPVVASPRALFEPGLNEWLGEVIGDPTKMICQVETVGQQGDPIQDILTLNSINLPPIDLVYVIGGELQAGTTELETRIAYEFRRRKGIGPEASVKITFNPPTTNSNQRTIAQVFPLLRELRSIITTSRPVSARDYAPNPIDLPDRPDLHFGWADNDLKKRLGSALKKLRSELTKISLKRPNINPAVGANPANFKALFEQFFAEGSNEELFSSLLLTENASRELLEFMRDATDFGMALAFPDYVDLQASLNKVDLLAKAAALWKTMTDKAGLAQAKMEEAEALDDDINDRVNLLIEAGQALFGEDFLVIPRFRYTNPTAVAQSFEDEAQLLDHVCQLEQTTPGLAMEAWIQSVCRVRESVGRLERTRMLTEAISEFDMPFQPVQTPFREGDSWLAVVFPETYQPTGEPFGPLPDAVSLAVHGNSAAKTNQLQCGILIDEWTETIPVAEETTGIAFHYDQPNATAPNTLLLAVEPTGSDNWSWETLQGILDDTFRRAKSRAVESKHVIEDPVLGTLLPMTAAFFDLNNGNVSLDYLVASEEFIATQTAQSFELYNPWTNDEQ